MQFPRASLLIGAILCFLAYPCLSLGLPPIIARSEPNTTLPSAETPIHVPVCYRSPGGFTLLLCARLLTNLKNLPTYTKEEIWSKFVTGESRLPAVFVQRDSLKSQACYLTFNLFQTPSVPITALERFSLADEQSDLNRIYFQCLKKGRYGIERIGTKGNVAALLGPQYTSDDIWDEHFPGTFANGSFSGIPDIVDLTSLDDNQTS
ncbi:hypothetical protein N7G274_001400 [Stereocaulon virgatum]|uniref:Uncharacterized protein n=1 Tax=Stereocaulon virgatum TaxID=373712 RepID=A0ABR4APB2_9LECA